MSDMNMYVCSGRIGGDAEKKQTSSGKDYATFSVAVSFYEAKGQYGTMWISCIVWGTRASFAAQALKKGTYATLSGQLKMVKGNDGNNYLNMNVSEISLPPRHSNASVDQEPQATLDDDIPF